MPGLLARRDDDDDRDGVCLDFDGAPLSARAGDTVAAALLAAGHSTLRETPVSAAARGPWCMMGVCFDCLVEIDGVGNRQACMVEVASGMRVARQRGTRALQRPADLGDG